MARRSARAVDAPAPLRAKLDRWLAACGSLRRNVRLASSPEIAAPVAVGPHRPSILLPARLLDALETGDLEQVGVHEAAHLARRDDYALLLQRLLEALFALHPVVRLIARQIDLEREIACDDFVVAATGQPRSYAACLTRMGEFAGGSSLAGATVAEHRSHLSRRVRMLLDKSRHTGTRLLRTPLAAMLALLAVLAWTAGKTPGLVVFAGPLSPFAAPSRTLPAPLPAQAAAPLPAPAEDPAGRVLDDASNNPVAGAELRFQKAGMRELAADLETDREGRFSAPGLPSGEYTVRVSKPNYLATAYRLQVPGPAAEVRLVRYGAIEGQVTNAEGKPLPGKTYHEGGRTFGSARITVLAKAPNTGELRPFRDTRLEDEGRYRIYGLPRANTPSRSGTATWTRAPTSSSIPTTPTPAPSPSPAARSTAMSTSSWSRAPCTASPGS